jgi:hypothetical protein
LIAGAALVAVCLGCSESRELSELRAAAAKGDEDRILDSLIPFRKSLEGADRDELEKTLLELRKSRSEQVKGTVYRIAARHKLPAFVELYDDLRRSEDPGERGIVAFHPMTVEDSLQMLGDDEEFVRVEAMMGAYSLRGVDVEPVVRKGLKVGLETGNTTIQYDAVGLANERGVTSVAPEVMALLKQKRIEGLAYEMLEERIVNYVRNYRLEQYYDEIDPFEAALAKREYALLSDLDKTLPRPTSGP